VFLTSIIFDTIRVTEVVIMKKFTKKLFLVFFIGVFLIVSTGCDNFFNMLKKGDISFVGFTVMGEEDITLSFERGLSNSVNPFGASSQTIEEKINEEISIDNKIKISYKAEKNEDIYLLAIFKNEKKNSIESVVISGMEYKKDVFEEGSDFGRVLIKVNVGSSKTIKEFKLEKIKYLKKNEDKELSVRENNVVNVAVGDIGDIDVSVSSEVAGKSRFEFYLEVEDVDSLLKQAFVKVRVVLYDGVRLVKNVEISQSGKVVFEKLEVNKLYQYAVVGTYDKFDGNGTKNYVLVKKTFSTSASEYSIEVANISNGKVSVSSKQYSGENVVVSVLPNNGYKLSKLYYIEEGKTNKVYVENSFIMPSNNIKIYAEFVKGYKISKVVVGDGKLNVSDIGLQGEMINPGYEGLNKSTHITEIYYVEEGSSTKHYFINEFKMPSKNITIYATFGKDVYVSSKEELAIRTKEVERKTVSIILENDINLGGMEWTPINMYGGVFDGAGHTISNFKITSKREHNGLFGYVEESIIKNLNVTNVVIDFSVNDVSNRVGCVVGELVNSTLENVTARGELSVVMKTVNVTNIGGVVGSASKKSVIRKVSFEGEISAKLEKQKAVMRVGGIAGSLSTTGVKVEECFSKVDINTWNGDGHVGGLFGEANFAEISNCSSDVDIDCLQSDSVNFVYLYYIGGAMGSGLSSKISGCSVKGNINVESYGWIEGGGFSGQFGKCDVINSYTEVDITINDSGCVFDSHIGGFVGYFSLGGTTIENSYCSGDIEINNSEPMITGGFAGAASGVVITTDYGKDYIKNSYTLSNITIMESKKAEVDGFFSGDMEEVTLENVFIYNGQVIDAENYEVLENVGKVSKNTILSFINSNWDSSIWNFNGGLNPTLK